MNLQISNPNFNQFISEEVPSSSCLLASDLHTKQHNINDNNFIINTTTEESDELPNILSKLKKMKQLIFLGTSSGVPTPLRNVSSCGLQLDNGEVYLIDSGEGTQQQLQVCL